VIFLRDVELRRAAKTLLSRATATFYRGQKVGVTGANGVGKSSLFALIVGELHCDSGEVDLQPGIVIAQVGQELPRGGQPAIEFVLDGDTELRALESSLGDAQRRGEGMQIAALHDDLNRIGGYAARARAAQLMSGLGFGQAGLARPIDDFSGGWQVRLNLARALMCRSDLLLLDEPTNHLDLDAIVWLEGWLRAYSGTLLLISHDRDFLDNTVQTICHVENATLRVYQGNYSAFERQRAEQLAQQQLAFEKQQREIAHMHAFIERFRAKATKARQAQSRLKALARLELIAPAHVDSPFDFEFRRAASHPDPAIAIDDADVGYGGNPVLHDMKFTLRAGARVGLLGRNGAGKSTLVRLLAGELAPGRGSRVEGKGLAIGYFAQRQLDQLRPGDSPLAHLQRLDPLTREQDLRDFLGGFDFRGDAALAPVGRFSGGERSRLALALIAWQRPNLLLLDEPTNHLDLQMRHSLLCALQAFEGAMVLVSHDRSLLRAACDELWLVDGGVVTEFAGDLDDYTRHLQASAAEPAIAPAGTAAGRKAQRRLDAQARGRLSARRKPLEAELRVLEGEVTRLAAERDRLEKLIASPDIYADSRKEDLKRCLLERARVSAQLTRVEERWLELSEELEALQGH
jgi:ATP-binding cassette subfamily F protein 3